MEYIPRGNLETFLTEPLPEADAQRITFQVLEGLEVLHENGFSHRSLKPTVGVARMIKSIRMRDCSLTKDIHLGHPGCLGGSKLAGQDWRHRHQRAS